MLRILKPEEQQDTWLHKPVFAKCYHKHVVRELSLSYGVFPSHLEIKKSKFKMVRASLKSLVKNGSLKKDDTVIYVGGSFGIGGGSTFMEISTVEKLTFKNEGDK